MRARAWLALCCVHGVGNRKPHPRAPPLAADSKCRRDPCSGHTHDAAEARVSRCSRSGAPSLVNPNVLGRAVTGCPQLGQSLHYAALAHEPPAGQPFAAMTSPPCLTPHALPCLGLPGPAPAPLFLFSGLHDKQGGCRWWCAPSSALAVCVLLWAGRPAGPQPGWAWMAQHGDNALTHLCLCCLRPACLSTCGRLRSCCQCLGPERTSAAAALRSLAHLHPRTACRAGLGCPVSGLQQAISSNPFSTLASSSYSCSAAPPLSSPVSLHPPHPLQSFPPSLDISPCRRRLTTDKQEEIHSSPGHQDNHRPCDIAERVE